MSDVEGYLGKIIHDFLHELSRFWFTEIYVVNICTHLRTNDTLDNVRGGQMLGYDESRSCNHRRWPANWRKDCMSLKCTDTLEKDDLIDICNEFVKTFAAEQQWLGNSKRDCFEVRLYGFEDIVHGLFVVVNFICQAKLALFCL